jgi:two-component system, NtrC family, nitrogen regulation sensor histidine kinase NtrY
LKQSKTSIINKLPIAKLVIALLGMVFCFGLMSSKINELIFANESPKELVKLQSQRIENNINKVNEWVIENKFDSYLNDNNFNAIGLKAFQLSGTTIQIFNKDSLVFWSDNNTLLLNKAIPFDKPIFVKELIDDGVYYKKKIGNDTTNNTFIIAKINLKKNYTQKNSYLVSSFFDGKLFDKKWALEATKINEKNIEVQYKNTILYYLDFSNFDAINSVSLSELFVMLPFIGFLLFLFFVSGLLSKFINKYVLFVAVIAIVFGLRYVQNFATFQVGVTNSNLFNPAIFAQDYIMKSLGDVLFNLIILGLLCFYFFYKIHYIPPISKVTFTTVLKAVLLVFFTISMDIYLYFLGKSIVLNSNIHFDITLFTTNNSNTLIAIACITIIVFLMFIIGIYLVRSILEYVNGNLKYYFGITIISIVFEFIMFRYFCTSVQYIDYFFVLYSSIFNVLMILPWFRKVNGPFNFESLLIILLVAVSATFFVFQISKNNNKSVYDNFANNLLPNRNISEEKKLGKIISNAFLAIQSSHEPDSTLISNSIVSAVSSNKQVNYNYSYYYKIVGPNASTNLPIKYQFDFEKLIAKAESSLDVKDLYYVNVNFNGPQYVSKCTTAINQIVYFVVINEALNNFTNISVFNNIEKDFNFFNEMFDVGFYENDYRVLQTSNADFPYKLDSALIKETKKLNQKFQYHTNNYGQSLLVSLKENSLIKFSIIFFFLFLFVFLFVYSFFIILFLYKSNYNYKAFRKLLSTDLKFNFLASFIVVEIIALFFLSYLSLRVFDATNTENIEKKLFEKTEIVTKAMQQWYNTNTTEQNIKFDEAMLQNQLQNLSQNQNIKFDFFNTQGHLIFASDKSIFTYHTIGEQLNAQVFFNTKNSSLGYQVLNENLNNLKYKCAYTKILNRVGQVAYYLRLADYNSNIDVSYNKAKFKAILYNIFLLLLIFTAFLSFILSRFLFRKLNVLTSKFKSFSIQGNNANEYIQWPYNDEIGTLVKQYNIMVANVKTSADKMVLQEKELAWREMAKQVAHEIKNPLTPIKLTLQNLQNSIARNDKNVLEKTKNAANSILLQIEQLNTIAGTFSEFATLPSIVNSEFVLNDLLQEVVMLNKNTKEGTIDLEYISWPTPLLMHQDKMLIRRVLNNVLSNAFQSFVDDSKGEIQIRLVLHNLQARIAIKDNGMGINDEVRKNIFQPYFTTKNSGTGLGLAMCKEIISKMNGDIWYESEVNKGTTFYIDLPLQNT